MTQSIELYSFSNHDRSGKVRWLAYELGLQVTENRVEPGHHVQAPYTDLNPYGTIPTVIWQGRTMLESNAICKTLAEQYPDSKFIVMPDEDDRACFLEWTSIACESLESPLVEFFLSGVGIRPPELQALIKAGLKKKLEVTINRLPKSGFLIADRFTLADIFMSYSLRLAINGKLIALDEVNGYLQPLMEREAAIKAGFFGSIQK